MIGYSGPAVNKKVKPLRLNVFNELLGKLRKGTLNKDELPQFIDAPSKDFNMSLKLRHDVIPHD